MKKCPFCAEEIQEEAVVCKHCKRDLPVATPPQAPESAAEVVDARGHIKGGFVLAMIGVGACLLWTQIGQSFESAGWVLLAGLLLFWFGMARTINGSGVVKYAGSFLLTVLMLAAVIWLVDGRVSGLPERASDGRSSAERAGLNKATFDRIHEGMSYDEVVRVVGAAGTLASSSDLAGVKTVMYTWTNPNGSNMNAMFQNGRLVQKAQFGLR